MRVLLDENLPHDLIAELAGHEVVRVQGFGWAGVKMTVDGAMADIEQHLDDAVRRYATDLLTADAEIDIDDLAEMADQARAQIPAQLAEIRGQVERVFASARERCG